MLYNTVYQQLFINSILLYVNESLPPPPPPPPVRSSLKILFFAIFLVFSVPCFSDENRWYDRFFLEGAYHQYFAPELLNDYVETGPGFRAALGYEYCHFLFALESGYTHINGTNPLVLETIFTPLALKAGYNFPIRFGFGLQGYLLAGYIFSRTSRYKNAINMMMGKLQEDSERHFFPGARLYGTWTISGGYLKVFAGGGVDIVPETDGSIPLPLIEAGISFKPFVLLRKMEQRKIEPLKPEPEILEPEVTEQEITKPEITEVIEETAEIIETKPEEQEVPKKRIELSRAAVYFVADSTDIVQKYRPILDEVGKKLKANPELCVTLQGYTAPTGTEDGRLALSAARSWYCAEYLMRVYGIAEQRVNIEFYSADETSEQKVWELRRRVDLIIEQGEE